MIYAGKDLLSIQLFLSPLGNHIFTICFAANKGVQSRKIAVERRAESCGQSGGTEAVTADRTGDYDQSKLFGVQLIPMRRISLTRQGGELF